MKKAFTLSEALITLAIIGVLAAILVPVINNVRPDKDKITYKKALYTMQSAVSDAMESTVYTMAANSAAYWKDSNVGDADFCNAVADSLNTSGSINCSGSAGSSSYSNPNFVTTDGVRYWGLEGKFNGDTRDICVDRKMSAGEYTRMTAKRSSSGSGTTDCTGGMKIQVRYDGKVSTPGDNAAYNYENDLIENSYSITETDS